MPSDEQKQAKQTKHPTASQLAVYSEGKGTGSFRAAVAQHLQICSECAALVDSAHGLEVRSDTKVEPVVSQGSASTFSNDRTAELIDHPQYAIERELGRGGMGIVYLVKHKLTGRREALKVLMPSLVEREDIRIRFLREIQAAASLDHPHICRTLNAFNDGKVLGLVMEYLPGSDLAHFVLQNGPMPIRSACSLAIQLCAGLQHAHEKGMIHRDIKPGNLMVDQSPKDGLRLKILDFGLARGMMDDSPEQRALTVDGRVLGTPEFMSPEQALTPSAVDVRSDLYSVGCVLYFMLTGSAPFQGETALSILQSHLSKQATPLTAINPEIPVGLWAVVASLLEKDRNHRPSSPEDVIRLLTPFVKSAVAAAAGDSSQIASNPPVKPPDSKQPESFVSEIRIPPRRPIRKKKQTLAIAKLIPIFLPTFVILGAGYFFKDSIHTAWKEFTEPSTSKIVLKNMPPDYEICIDDQRTSFTRSSANSLAEVIARPGTYKLTLKKYGVTKSEQTVTVVAGRNVEITVAANDPPPKIEPTTTDGGGNRRGKGGGGENETVAQGETVTEPDSDPWRDPPIVPPTAEEIQLAIEGAKKALRNRDAQAAKSALAAMFNERGKLRLEESRPEATTLLQLDKFADTLSAFNATLASSIAKRQPNESVYIGQIRHTFLGKTENEISLLRNNETISLRVTELPCEIEQCLLDLELDSEPQYGGLVKAVGLLSHPKKTPSDVEFAKKQIQSAIKANFISGQFETIANEFANDVVEAEAAPKQRTYSVQRRLSGADGEVEKLFLLPPNIPYPKQTTLIASVLNMSFRGSAEAPFWNINNGEKGQHQPIMSPLWACEVPANGKWMVTFGETSPQTNLRIYAFPLANPIFQLSDLDDQRSTISISADSRSLAACTADELYIRWNLATKVAPSKVASKSPIGRDKLAALTIRPNSMDLVAAAAKDGSIRIWRTTDGSESCSANDVSLAVRAVQFSRKGDKLIVVRENGLLELRDLSLNVVQTFRSHSAPLTASGFSTKGRFLVTADCYNNVRLWETDELKIAAAFSVGDSSKITAVTTDAEGDVVVIGHLDSSIGLWSKK